MPKRKVTKEKGSTKKGLSIPAYRTGVQRMAGRRATGSITRSRKSRAFRARPTALGTIVEPRSLENAQIQKLLFPDTNNVAS